jgi:transcriptional regulator with XRE-family HTH domain
MKFFKEKFVALRQSSGLTQKQVADALGVVEASVSGWENGTNSPRPARISKLAALLHCEVADLAQFGGPLELSLDSLKERHELVKDLFFGADIGDELDNIQRALASRSDLSKKDKNYAQLQAEDNAEIVENLQRLFVKLSDRLQVRFSPGSGRGLDDFKFGLIRELIKSDLPADAKDKALQVVEKYHG